MTVTFPLALHALVERLQAQVYERPALAIEAARQLLKQCHAPEQLAFVYEQMGFAHLILGEHRLSCLFYEQARALQPYNMYVLANLAHARYELGEREEAVAIGRQALQLKDQLAYQDADADRLLLSPYAGSVNLIAFSLYGHLSRYGEMAVLNVLAARRHLPDFVCRFYTDSSVPPALVQRLKSLGAQCIDMGEQAGSMPATFWRFLAMDDEQADCVLVRDVDALIDAREAWCVRDWQTSGLPFHIVRDDCCHTELILAGLWGIRSGVLRDVRQRIHHFLERKGDSGWKRYGDQLFLREALWPAVRGHALTHDTVYGFGQRVHAVNHSPEPSQGPRNSFMGANHATAQIDCTIEDQLPPDGQVVARIMEASGSLVCCHPMQAVPDQRGHWRLHLPQLYADRLQSGLWRVHVSGQAHAEGLGSGSIDPVLLGIGTA